MLKHLPSIVIVTQPGERLKLLTGWPHLNHIWYGKHWLWQGKASQSPARSDLRPNIQSLIQPQSLASGVGPLHFNMLATSAPKWPSSVGARPDFVKTGLAKPTGLKSLSQKRPRLGALTCATPNAGWINEEYFQSMEHILIYLY